jgi:dTDP-4-dehydrorhamnose reductase
MKILVIGANGQVGYCLAQILKTLSYDFKALTRAELDITNLMAVTNVVNAYVPNIIINAAAYTAVDKAESDAANAYAINCQGAANLAHAANAVEAAVFHISTDYVFAGNATEPYTETDATAPQGVYGESKLHGELYVAVNNPKHIILRTAWVFGEHGNNFVKTMIRLGRSKDQLGVVADQHGGPTYAGDIAQALIAFVKKYENTGELNWGVYHYAGMPQVSWYEFAKAIFCEVEAQGIYEKPTPVINAIETKDYPTPAKRPANSRLNCEKIKHELNLPASDWQNALKNIKAYL